VFCAGRNRALTGALNLDARCDADASRTDPTATDHEEHG
jgi:hypothetical protein